jgi:hypothetical protein
MLVFSRVLWGDRRVGLGLCGRALLPSEKTLARGCRAHYDWPPDTTSGQQVWVQERAMNKIRGGFILPSAVYTVPRSEIHSYVRVDKAPIAGDLAYGRMEYLGQHSSLENKQGRIHTVNDGARAIFVFGNRYAPDFYEAVVPDEFPETIDLIARSGMIGTVRCKNASVKDPTRVRLDGYVCDGDERVLNTRDFCRLKPKATEKRPDRAKMILSIGTSMNSGKSMTAAACCWALRATGHNVRACKVTGTASLKDILLMEDNGAHPVGDFTYLGYPSTYLLDEADLVGIFDTLDLKYANSPKNYWVVEFADGILQRETAMLLRSESVRSRVHRVIFSACDALGAIGGLALLEERFGIRPHAVSGVCSSSPLGIRELQGFSDLPIVDNMRRNAEQITSIVA